MLFSQPIAEEPFRFETELDDLPKEKLKGKLNINSAALILINIVCIKLCLGTCLLCNTKC